MVLVCWCVAGLFGRLRVCDVVYGCYVCLLLVGAVAVSCAVAWALVVVSVLFMLAWTAVGGWLRYCCFVLWLAGTCSFPFGICCVLCRLLGFDCCFVLLCLRGMMLVCCGYFGVLLRGLGAVCRFGLWLLFVSLILLVCDFEFGWVWVV